ncbi:MAG: peptidylprolyl isomerase [Dokdonella sp.]|uniref:peptidylprolyl isomerase n=1 Tax=Dokdonella sp. TaxID=2291710 RepID=UPI003F7DCB90
MSNFVRFAVAVAFQAGALLFVPASARADSARADANEVIASQGGAKVTFGDIDAFAEPMPALDRSHFFDSPQRIQSLITNMLLQRQLAADARKRGLDKDPDVLASKAGVTDAVLAAAEVRRFRDELVIPDFSELAHERYIAYPEKYAVGGVFDVKQILVSTGIRSDDDAKALAEKAAAEAHADPAQFDALVEKYSDDPGKSRDHGLVKHADSMAYDETFRAAARALQTPGAVSPLVKTEFGYHVLQLVQREQAQRQPFESVREDVIAALKSEYIEKTVRNHLDTLRNNPLDANPAYVAALRTRYKMDAPPESPAPAAATNDKAKAAKTKGAAPASKP